MTRKFLNREGELQILEEDWRKGKFELVVIYGRRRIGKTELIKEFIKDKKNTMYFMCSERKIDYNLRRFSEEVCRLTNMPIVSFKSFQDAFDALLNRAKNSLILAIDEFGYLVKEDAGVLSDFQEIIDNKLRGKSILLLLCGSSISLMETRVLGHRSPLYGRATRYIKVEPFDFPDMRLWFPNSELEDLVKIYAVTNGVAKYLEFFSGRRIMEEIEQNFFNPSSFLFLDALKLLSDELRDYTTYVQVLEAISLGYNRINQIADYAFLQPKDTFFYLKVLSSMGIVKRVIPIFSPRKAKRGIYVIDDNYFDFWFRFVSPFQAEIESGLEEVAVSNFRAGFNEYLGKVFEKIGPRLLLRRASLPFQPMKIGRWWHKDKEIDLVVANEREKNIAFFEVKWGRVTEKEARKILDGLDKNSDEVKWPKEGRKHFGLISMKVENKEELRKTGYLVYDLKDLVG